MSGLAVFTRDTAVKLHSFLLALAAGPAVYLIMAWRGGEYV